MRNEAPGGISKRLRGEARGIPPDFYATPSPRTWIPMWTIFHGKADTSGRGRLSPLQVGEGEVLGLDWPKRYGKTTLLKNSLPHHGPTSGLGGNSCRVGSFSNVARAFTQNLRA